MNPFLKRLGFSASDRVVIIHADDIGMNYGSVVAYADLIETGMLSSAATMVPCPWFPAAATLCRAYSDDVRIDMGVHLTLTSEWEPYRWGPLSTGDPASGLLDAEGYLHHLARGVHEHARSEAVGRELRAQVERALAAGIDVTHVDSHMLTLFHPRLLPIYLDIAREFGLPPFLVRLDEAHFRRSGFGVAQVETLTGMIRQAEAQGAPLFDYVHIMSLDQHEDRLGEMQQVLDELPAGLSSIILHPSADSPALRAIAPDWRSRVADYELLRSEALRKAIDHADIQIIGFRTLRDAIRNT